MKQQLWIQNLMVSLPICPQITLQGNIDDFFIIDTGNGKNRPATMVDSIFASLKAKGYVAIIVISPAGVRVLADDDATLSNAQNVFGITPDEPSWKLFSSWPQKVQAFVVNPLLPVAVIFEGAERFVNPASGASDEAFAFFVAMERLMHRATLLRRQVPGTSDSPYYNPIIWTLRGDARLPAWFGLKNERLRHIDVPLPNRHQRHQAASTFIASTETKSIENFVDSTDGLSIVSMQQIARIAKDASGHEFSTHLDEATRTYRVGVLDNPWRQQHLMHALKQAETILAVRVMGQPHAIKRAIDIIKRAAMGLTGAHVTGKNMRPRGVLFFAGPTGVGKTELAKALTELIFRDETAYIRFDMSEFSAEHSDQRLIGAPPSYVGFEAGGELTNAVRRKPFSLLLFDEIEKAHPRILDKFLQILEDGRLTDGRGETVYFSECLIVFTSNLGMARSDERNQKGEPLNSETPFDELRTRVLASIQEHFIVRLGRPELLNRLGDNIEIFDFIRPAVGQTILISMLQKIKERVKSQFDCDLDFSRALDRITELCVGDLTNGGRGIGNKVETYVVNPLARLFFENQPAPSTKIEIDFSTNNQLTWSLTL